MLHEKARLGILTALASQVTGVGFVELKSLCHLTDGNLSRHLKVLEEAGLVEIRKRPQGTRTRTTALMTRAGRAQFLRYLDELERVIRDARPRAEGCESPDTDGPAWSPA
ncbi:MAG: transcriptional regulator [Planctomycetota bacterium]